jgi:DnaJ-class molecular chaperone
VKKVLKRKGKRLEVRIPAGVKTGSVVRLRNARQISDGLPGDILIKVIVK